MKPMTIIGKRRMKKYNLKSLCIGLLRSNKAKIKTTIKTISRKAKASSRKSNNLLFSIKVTS